MKYIVKFKDIADIGDKPPDWFKVFPSGEINIEDDSPVFLSKEEASKIIQRFKSNKKDMVIDYEHATLSGNPAPAAGWITDFEWRDDGLWAKASWTEKAAAHIAAREYRYYSPVFLIDKKTRKIEKLHNIAITNQPRMNGLNALIAKDIIFENLTQEDLMKDKLTQILNLPAESDDSAVFGAIETMIAKVKQLESDATAAKNEAIQAKAIIAIPEIYEALSLKKDAGKSELIATIHALKQEHGKTDELRTELMALKAKFSEKETAELVQMALTQGKITPAQKEWAEKYAQSDSEGFRLFIAKAPVVVPVGKTEIKKEDIPDKKKEDSETEEIQAKLDAQLNITKEMREKYEVKGGK